MKDTDRVCPFCGAACNESALVEKHYFSSNGPLKVPTYFYALCQAGYSGWRSSAHPEWILLRLTHPIISFEKNGSLNPVSWEKANAFTADHLKGIKDTYISGAIEFTGTAQAYRNEINYTLQKFARYVHHAKNVECRAQLDVPCSVRGLVDTIGAGITTDALGQIALSRSLLITGLDCANSYPFITEEIINVKQRGAHIIVCAPRSLILTGIAGYERPIKYGCNIALVNAFGHVLLDEQLYDRAYVIRHNEGFDDYLHSVSRYSAERIETLPGSLAEHISGAVRMYTTSQTATLNWGMGLIQPGQYCEVVRDLASIALLTGNADRKNAGSIPAPHYSSGLGARDIKLFPSHLPGYQPVNDNAIREEFARSWDIRPDCLDDFCDVSINEFFERVINGKLKACHMMVDNHLAAWADPQQVSELFDAPGQLVLQDAFMNEAATIADVILPSACREEHSRVCSCSDSRSSHFDNQINAPGLARQGWAIIGQLAKRMGFNMHYENAEEIWDQMRSLCSQFHNPTIEKLARRGCDQWRCPPVEHKSTLWLGQKNVIATATGKGRIFASHWVLPGNQPDTQYPLNLCIVEELSPLRHVDETVPSSTRETSGFGPAYVMVNSLDAQVSGISAGKLIWISSRWGKVICRADVKDFVNLGAVYINAKDGNEIREHLSAPSSFPECETSHLTPGKVNISLVSDQKWGECYVYSTCCLKKSA